ncbi:MAG TPA: phosphatase PAP2 family protein [Chthoniobacterales bacterium]|nr:phosphatase PAP2 family protein [Chthoniobacterales bacterium]
MKAFSAPERRNGWTLPMRFLRSRFSRKGYLGLHLTLGLIVIVTASACFTDVAEDMSQEAATRMLGERVAVWFHAHATSGWTEFARLMSSFGSVAFLAGASAVSVILSLRKRAWSFAVMLAVTMLGRSLLNLLLKHIFHRHRPGLENPLVTLNSFGFPSGHTMGASLFYGLLALWAMQLTSRTAVRVLIAMAAALVIAAVGWSRIYLGAHYLTDVLGAIAASIAWLTVCWTGLETFRRWHRLRRGDLPKIVTRPGNS